RSKRDWSSDVCSSDLDTAGKSCDRKEAANIRKFVGANGTTIHIARYMRENRVIQEKLVLYREFIESATEEMRAFLDHLYEAVSRSEERRVGEERDYRC